MNAEKKIYRIRSSEKCYRFKPDAFCSHAPLNKGIYELVTFDENQNPKVLFVGAAFEKGIRECLEAHAAGTLAPSSDLVFSQFPNLYFDYLIEMDGAKSAEDAQDVYAFLVQKHKPIFNDVQNIKPTLSPELFDVVELE